MINPKIVKLIREELNYSQEDMARELKVSYTTINRWENYKSAIKGKNKENIESLYKKVFKVEELPPKYGNNLKAYALFAGAGGFHLGMEKQFEVLVATDIASRGIDIDELSHVINFDLPNISETYVHRIGRTGRAGASGIALSFCDAEEKTYLKDIQKLTGEKIPVVQNHPFTS